MGSLLLVLPHFLKYHQQDFAIILMINILVVVSYRLMTLTGEWSLIHIIMMGVGAYASTLLTKELGLSFWLSLGLSSGLAAAVAYILSFPLLRMKVMYFLIGSFSAGEAIRLSWSFFKVPFGGAKGIKQIPSPEIWIPGAGYYEIWESLDYYYLVLGFVVLCIWLLYLLEHSRFGLTLHAVHWNDSLAESIGINTHQYKTLSFVIASFFVGFAGVLYAHKIGTINPHQYNVSAMVYVLIWCVMGGTKKFYGPILGVVILSVFNEFFREANELRPAIYGGILIAVMLFLPNGLESLPQKILKK